jgi:2-methylisocitrate lyase-like PEP mutase family enzyme
MSSEFRALHRPGQPLVLPNAWDVASAKLVEAAGAAAVATTSAGVAWGLGAPDGGKLDRYRAVDLVARVAEAVAVPVTADIEDGYAADADGVAATVKEVLHAGAVGVNLEDADHTGVAGLRAVDDQVARIAAACRAGGTDLFVNARVDSFLFGSGTSDEKRADALARGRAYLAAGADGVFVPGVVDPEAIAELVAGLDGPLNVMVGPGAPDVATLAGLGVARVSLGAAVALAAYTTAWRVAKEVLTAGTYESATGDASFPNLNALLSR